MFRPISEELGWDSKIGEGDMVVLFRSLVFCKLASCDDPRYVMDLFACLLQYETLVSSYCS